MRAPPQTARWALAAAGVGAFGRALTGPLPLNYYDVGYALIWGNQIVNGHVPTYRLQAASTPHPLATTFGALAALFGTHGSWIAVQVILFAAFGAAIVALFALTQRSFGSRPAGALAAGALALSPPFLTDALGGSGLADLPALALVLGAAALFAVRPARPWPPVALLALAGLLRPEAWGLAALLWLWLAFGARRPRGELVRLGFALLAPPLLWLGSDALITGDAGYSLTRTQAATRGGAFVTGLGEVPHQAIRDLSALLGLPVLIAGALGAVLALLRRQVRPAAFPALLLLAAALGEFAALGLLGVPLIERFLLLAAAMLALFFGYLAGAAPRELPHGTGRQLALIAAASVVLVVLASDAARIRHIRGDQRAAVQAQSDLVLLGELRSTRALLSACAPGIYVPRFTLISLMSYDLHLSPSALSRTRTVPPPRGVVLAPRSPRDGQFFGFSSSSAKLLRQGVLTGFHAAGGNRSWVLWARGCGS